VIGCFKLIVFWCAIPTWLVIIGGQEIALLCQDRIEEALIKKALRLLREFYFCLG
jgi:hypothetical protein